MCRSFPGVGPLTAATLLAEIGEDRDHYPAVGVLLAEAGLAPVTRSSGRSHRVGFRYAANSRLREACTWWAYNSLKTSPWARAAYDDARARKQPHHRALRGLGARWMRALWRAWTDGVPYNQARHLKSGAAREVRTAKPRSRSDARAVGMPPSHSR
jgi:transposase